MKSSTQLIPWNTSDIICAYLLDSKGRNLPSKQGFASGVRGPKYFTIDIKKKYWAFKERKYYADRRKLMVICARRLLTSVCQWAERQKCFDPRIVLMWAQ